jgi:flagellar hook-basal body complex protein FliE
VLNAIGLAPTKSATDAAGIAEQTTGAKGNAFTQMLEGLQGAHNNADSLAQAAATGNLSDIHNYTIAATEAQLMTDLTVAIRNRAVESFNEIMRMQP